MPVERAGATLGAVFSEVTVGGTRVDPTLASEGMDLTGVAAWRVYASADTGQSLTGAGEFQFFIRSAALGRWAENKELKVQVTPAGITWGTNRQDIALGDRDILVRGGRLVVAPKGVGVTSGNVTITIETFQF